MILKTIKSSKQYKWNKHFLWIPKKVRMTNDIDKTDGYTIFGTEFEYAWLWLETVQRKDVGDLYLNTDDGKFIYWKEL